MSQHHNSNESAIKRHEALEAANERAELQMSFLVQNQKAEVEKFESLSKKFKKSLENMKRNDMIFNYVLATLGVLLVVATLVGFCYQLSVHNFTNAILLGVFLAFELLMAFFTHTVNGLFDSIAKIEEMIGD